MLSCGQTGDDLLPSNSKLPFTILPYKLASSEYSSSLLYCAEAGLLNTNSCLAPALGVAKFTNERYYFGHTLLC
jgi:hypothetical protein